MKRVYLVITINIFFLIARGQQSQFAIANELIRYRSSGGNATILLDSNVAKILADAEIYPSGKDMVYFENNPLLKELFTQNESFTINKDIQSLTTNDLIESESVFSNISGLNLTSLTNALADVLIVRAKQELSISFFNKFQKYLSKHEECIVLFPNTNARLKNLLEYSYQQVLPALRQAFLDDIKVFPGNIYDVLQMDKFASLRQQFPEFQIALRYIELIQRFSNSSLTAGAIIHNLALLPEWEKVTNRRSLNLFNTVKLASIFSEAFLKDKNYKVWYSESEVAKCIKDDFFLKLFAGLMYEQISKYDIKFILKDNRNDSIINCAHKFIEFSKDLHLFRYRILGFIKLTDRLKSFYDKLPKNKDEFDFPSKELILSYYESSFDLIEYLISTPTNLHIVQNLDLNNELISTINSVFKNIELQHYTYAIDDGMRLFQIIINTSFERSGDSSLPEDILKSEMDKVEEFELFIQKLRPYAIFMANLVEAKNEQEVSNAIENAILPIGSSSIKKYSNFNFSIQSYVGGFYNFSSHPNNSSWNNNFGLFAPIGLEITPYTGFKNYGSLSLFISLLDIGAIIDYKLKLEPIYTGSDSLVAISKSYKVNLGQIFSPGGYLVYGAPANLPLSLGFGAQFGPGLSKISSASLPIYQNPSWRFNLFLAVDLPLFTLSNRKKYK